MFKIKPLNLKIKSNAFASFGLASLISFGLLAQVVHADAVLDLQNAQQGVDKIYIKNGKIKFNEIIFDSETEKVIVINHKDKSFYEIDEQVVSNAVNQMAPAMEMMQKKLANMTPEQKQMMKQYMPENMRGMIDAQPTSKKSVEKVSVKKLSATDTINGFRCTYYELVQAEQKKQQACVASQKELGLSGQDYKALQKMFGFFNKIAAKASQFIPQVSPGEILALSSLDGLPVVVKTHAGQTQGEIKAIAIQSVDGGMYQVPANYKQKSPAAGIF